MDKRDERFRAAMKEAHRIIGEGDFRKTPDEALRQRIQQGVMAKLDRDVSRKGFTSWRSLLERRISVPILPLAAAALVFLFVAALVFIPRLDPGPLTVEVHLSFHAPEAARVVVVGDWNGWDPQGQLLQDRDGDGIWEISFTVDPDGEYQYQFVIDDETWLPDPDAWLQVPDGFGGINSVLDTSLGKGTI